MSGATIRVLSLGAGVQSTALFILGCEGELLPKIDAAVFADTQWEPEHVNEHLDRLVQYGEEHGVPTIRASKGSLPNDVLDPRVFATLPAWTLDTIVDRVPTRFATCPTCRGGEWSEAQSRATRATSTGASTARTGRARSAAARGFGSVSEASRPAPGPSSGSGLAPTRSSGWAITSRPPLRLPDDPRRTNDNAE